MNITNLITWKKYMLFLKNKVNMYLLTQSTNSMVKHTKLNYNHVLLRTMLICYTKIQQNGSQEEKILPQQNAV